MIVYKCDECGKEVISSRDLHPVIQIPCRNGRIRIYVMDEAGSPDVCLDCLKTYVLKALNNETLPL